MHLCRFCREWADWDYELNSKNTKIFIPVCGFHLGELKKLSDEDIDKLIGKKRGEK